MNYYAHVITKRGIAICKPVFFETDNLLAPEYESITKANAEDFSSYNPVYLKFNLGLIEEKITAEKDAVDIQRLTNLKESHKASFRIKTGEILAAGFTYDSKAFGLDLEAKGNWDALHQHQTIMSWPQNISAVDGSLYSLELTNLDAFIGAALVATRTIYDTEYPLRASVDAIVMSSYATFELANTAVIDIVDTRE